MNRREVMRAILLSGYHSDKVEFVKLSGLNIISTRKAFASYNHGVKARLKGISCDCKFCQKKSSS